MLVIQTALASGRRAKVGSCPAKKENIHHDVSKPRCFGIEYNKYRSKGAVRGGRAQTQGGRAQTQATWIKDPGKGTFCRGTQGRSAGKKRITASKEPK